MALTVGLPPQGNTAWYAHYSDLDKAVRARVADGQGIYFDDFTGTDEARLTLALDAQQATANMPPIVLPARPLSFTAPRQMQPGLKIVGNGGLPRGQANPELSGGNYTGTEITLGGSIGSGTSAWWHNNNGGSWPARPSWAGLIMWLGYPGLTSAPSGAATDDLYLARPAA